MVKLIDRNTFLIPEEAVGERFTCQFCARVLELEEGDVSWLTIRTSVIPINAELTKHARNHRGAVTCPKCHAETEFSIRIPIER